MIGPRFSKRCDCLLLILNWSRGVIPLHSHIAPPFGAASPPLDHEQIVDRWSGRIKPGSGGRFGDLTGTHSARRSSHPHFRFQVFYSFSPSPRALREGPSIELPVPRPQAAPSRQQQPTTSSTTPPQAAPSRQQQPTTPRLPLPHGSGRFNGTRTQSPQAVHGSGPIAIRFTLISRLVHFPPRVSE